jgi:hypothetical protein
MAQNVYSVNVVGYVNVKVPANYSMIANPLNAQTNDLQNLIPNPPNFTSFLMWDGSGFTSSTYSFGTWSPNFTLAPGQGGFINPGPTDGFTNTFVGEVMQGSLSNAIPAGYSIISSQVPESGDADTLGLTDDLNNFDAVLIWNADTQQYESYTLSFGSWAPSVPSFEPGQSFFVNAGAATAWVRTFNVQ